MAARFPEAYIRFGPLMGGGRAEVNFGFNKPMLDLLFDTYKPTKKEWLDLGEASYKKEQAADGSIVIHMKATSL